jgi:hypothetical protein
MAPADDCIAAAPQPVDEQAPGDSYAPADDSIMAEPLTEAADDKPLPLPAGEAPDMSVVSEPREEAEASSTVDGDGPGDDTIIQSQAPLLALSGSAVAVLAVARELDSAPYPPPVRRVRSQTLKASQVCTAPGSSVDAAPRVVCMYMFMTRSQSKERCCKASGAILN